LHHSLSKYLALTGATLPTDSLEDDQPAWKNVPALFCKPTLRLIWGVSLERGFLFCYFSWKRWTKAETNGSASAEVLEELNQELDKIDLISPESKGPGYHALP